MLETIDTDTDLLLYGKVKVSIMRDAEGGVQIVAHPAPETRLEVRVAETPYRCILHLADGTDVVADLAVEDDWGSVQDCMPGDCDDWESALGWGNDADGDVKIESVSGVDGGPIPMDEFRRDVEDFRIHFQA
ncbi:MAG: hypothetical protein K6F50_06240 [Kiritimatiellae bacterium]|nr:hypothetical protein [Kiritimatiellia bacterium]